MIWPLLCGEKTPTPAPHPTPHLVQRPPLPPFPPGSYDRDLPPWAGGPPDKLIYRGNFCGIRVPGAPGVKGGMNATIPGGDTSLVMAAHLDRYPLDWQHAILERYASYGYTHLQQSIGHSEAMGQSISQYVATAKLIQSYGLWVDHWLLGGGRDEGSNQFLHRDWGWDNWEPVLTPWLDALLAEDAIDACCIGWQLDQFNTHSPRPWSRFGNPFQSIVDNVADRLVPKAIPIGTHWVNEAGVVFGDTYMDRFTFWRMQRNRLSWFHHQGDVDLPIPEYQAKLVDTLNPFGDGRMGTSGLFGDRPFGLVVYECSAQAQFDGRCTEDEGDLRSTLLVCTKARSWASYGNGGRQFNGTKL